MRPGPDHVHGADAALPHLQDDPGAHREPAP